MVSVTELPIDVKLLIVERLPDIESLKNVKAALPTFHGAISRYEGACYWSVLCNQLGESLELATLVYNAETGLQDSDSKGFEQFVNRLYSKDVKVMNLPWENQKL